MGLRSHRARVDHMVDVQRARTLPGTSPAFAFAHGGKTRSPQHGRVTIIVEGVNFAHVGKSRTGPERSTRRPLDDLEGKLAGAQGGHHEPPPLIGRVGLVVAPAAERDQEIQVEVRAAL